MYYNFNVAIAFVEKEDRALADMVEACSAGTEMTNIEDTQVETANPPNTRILNDKLIK